ncbi:MAG: glycosyltransferase family 2 protein, partial [Simkania sp.]|nr:glycosyltransferase family 2 protein [Simkania sp.]
MISATILTKNSEETLSTCLKALEGFNEVIVLDTGSTDLTLDIAQTFSNVKVFEAPFEGFGPLHNLAAEHATSDWILSLDSDEVLSDELSKEILALNLKPDCVYSFPFHNYFNGKHIRGCGWFPDRHIRLYNKTATHFSDDYVHEKILTKGLKEVKLTHAVKHYSYRSISDFLK